MNQKRQTKSSYGIRAGDQIQCSILPPPPLEASPEDIPLDIVYEDDCIIVINKAADMVMHPSAGHCSGTLVNALLHHYRLPAIQLSDRDGEHASSQTSRGLLGAENSSDDGDSSIDARYEDDDDDDDEGHYDVSDDDDAWPSPLYIATGDIQRHSTDGVIRPGIVHRLDKGTTGLVVVAKTDAAHASLSSQFKERSVERMYVSITLGVPQPREGRITTNIGRDFRDRKKMAAFAYDCTRGKTAASRYCVHDVLASGTAALVSWRLETGRTHQIRVHAKHIQHPLLGDETYGGGSATSARIIGAGKSLRISKVHEILKELPRPALHAQTLGFAHPGTGERLQFESSIPLDFESALSNLRDL